MAAERPATFARCGALRAKVGPVVLWSLALAVSAITLTVGNKWIMMDFDYPLTLLFVQNAVSAVVVSATVMCGGAKIERFTLAQAAIILGGAIVSTVQLAAALIAMPHVSIGTLTVFSNVRALIQSVAEFCVLRARFSWKEYAALAIIGGSGALYFSGDSSSTAVGMVWLAVNCVTYVALGLYKRFFFNKIVQSDAGISVAENVLTLPFILALALAAGEVPEAQRIGLHFALIPGLTAHAKAPWAALVDTSLSTKVLIVCTSLFASTMTVIYVNLFRLVAATSVTVLSNVNKVASIALGVLLFHKRIAATQVLALAIVIASGVWFGVERSKSRAQQRAAAAAAESAAATETEVELIATQAELSAAAAEDLRPLKDSDSASDDEP